MHAVANRSQLDQVAEIITPGEADIWGPERDENTLISFPHAPQPWNFPLRSSNPTDGGSNGAPASCTHPSSPFLHEHPSFLCPQCLNMQLALLTCMHFLPVLSANGYLVPADWREEGRPKQKNRDASRLSFLPLRLDCFALHISSHRGSHDLTFSMWCPILVELLCFQGLCLKARSEKLQPGDSIRNWIHQSGVIHFTPCQGRTDGLQHTVSIMLRVLCSAVFFFFVKWLVLGGRDIRHRCRSCFPFTES